MLKKKIVYKANKLYSVDYYMRGRKLPFQYGKRIERALYLVHSMIGGRYHMRCTSRSIGECTYKYAAYCHEYSCGLIADKYVLRINKALTKLKRRVSEVSI